MRAFYLAISILLALPGFAGAYNYWSITASTSPAIAGAITPPPDDANYLTTGATTNVISASVTSADFTVNPAPSGYRLSYVLIDGTMATPVAANTYRVNQGARVNHSISAYYQVQTYTITTVAGPYGIIDPTVHVAAGSDRTITMTANAGYQIDTVTVAGGPAPTGFSGQTSFAYTFVNVQSDKTITVAYRVIPLLVARIATSPQTILVNQPITIDGSTSTATVTPQYDWKVVDADTGAPASGASIGSGGVTAQFLPAQPGSYRIVLTLNNPLASPSSASVDIGAITQSVSRSNDCAVCHTARNPDIVAGYLASPHAASIDREVSCLTCHYQGGVVQHPGIVHPVDICNSCHLDAAGKVPGHPLAIGSSTCVSCHDAHSTTPFVASIQGPPHFNTITSARYPGSYVTSGADCSDCHFDSDRNAQIRAQWSASPHAATTARPWTEYDFKTLDGCARCHTTTGFVAYSTQRETAAWGTATDKTRELLTCKGCHADLGTGALRSVPAGRPYAGDSRANPDLGTSNLCLSCHSGTQSGLSIKARAAAGADFSNLPFIGSHSSATAGVLLGSIGYQYALRNYSNSVHFKHDRVGIKGFKAYGFATGNYGPCVACHMGGSSGHSFSPVAKDAGGVITSITADSCAGCHTGPAGLTAARLAARQAKLAASLSALRQVLEARGIFYNDTAPYFFRTPGNSDPADAVTDWGNADTMGAAFNFNLLMHETGAYAHNMMYAKRLIYDSIDYLDNGALDGSVPVTINALPGLAADQKALAARYLAPGGTRP